MKVEDVRLFHDGSSRFVSRFLNRATFSGDSPPNAGKRGKMNETKMNETSPSSSRKDDLLAKCLTESAFDNPRQYGKIPEPVRLSTEGRQHTGEGIETRRSPGGETV
jgi:hypothetical protein